MYSLNLNGFIQLLVCGLFGNCGKETIPSWISDGSSELQIAGDVVTCTASSVGYYYRYNAMWKDGNGINSGEHYWKINLKTLDPNEGAFVGLTNDDKFVKGGLRPNYVDIEGSWEITKAENVKISGKAFEGRPFRNRLATLTILRLESGRNSIYDVVLRVINSEYFQIERSGNTWKYFQKGTWTIMYGPPESMELEYKLSAAAKNPDLVQISGNQLILSGGEVEAVFDRFDDYPSPYTGNPFE